jgi:hypothetical protein
LYFDDAKDVEEGDTNVEIDRGASMDDHDGDGSTRLE